MEADVFIALKVKKGLEKTAAKSHNVDLEPATGRGIPDSSTSEVLSDGTADRAQMTVFPLSRCILMIDRLTGLGSFNARGLMALFDGEIAAKMLGIRQEADKKGGHGRGRTPDGEKA